LCLRDKILGLFAFLCRAITMFVVGVLGVVLPEAGDASIVLPVPPPGTQIVLELVAVGVPLYYLHYISSVGDPVFVFDLRGLRRFRYGSMVGAGRGERVNQSADSLGNRSVDSRDTRRY
jgi:hypothetical protein